VIAETTYFDAHLIRLKLDLGVGETKGRLEAMP
jgi:hypothetical protein